MTLPRVLAALGVVVAATVGPSQLIVADLPSDNVLPDLRMARLTDFEIETGADGGRRLRFTAVIANVGAGPMEAVGTLRDGQVGPVVQRVEREGGGPSEIPTDAQLYFAGDGHEHWHLRDMQGYRLERLDGEGSAVSEKHGFCLWDNFRGEDVPPGTPRTAAFSCPESLADGQVRMGLSVGWRDVYPASLPDQFIDVSGLDSGRYRLWAEADPAFAGHPTGLFTESDEANNLTWADLELDFETGSVDVVGYGPSA